MAAGALSIKLRCASWQQLATIYRRDLSKGTMFLKASTPPPVGTAVRIDLTLPSASVIVLNGIVAEHVSDQARGTGVELKLAPIPAGSIWMIESALASETSIERNAGRPARAGSQGNPAAGSHDSQPGVPQPIGPAPSAPVLSVTDGDELSEAETDLVRALVSEAESLKKLNAFLVLGVGYEATDADVRAAFGELTKRYHPDRFARYQSTELRSTAAEIFILIRDAYRRLGDEAGRLAVLASLGRSAAPRAVAAPVRAGTAPLRPPPRARTPVGGVPISASTASPASTGVPRATTDHRSGPIRAVLEHHSVPATPSAGPPGTPAPRPPPPPRPATGPMPALARVPAPGAVRAQTQPPPAPPPRFEAATSQGEVDAIAFDEAAQSGAATRPVHQPSNGTSAASSPGAITDASDAGQIEDLLDAGRVEDALNAYRLLSKKHPTDRHFRAGIELCEGMTALAARDRLEVAQRFESALEIDPANERAARELADMRRQATNERKGLLSRLMGKKEAT